VVRGDLEMNEGNSLGQGYNRPTGYSAEKAPQATFFSPVSLKLVSISYLKMVEAGRIKQGKIAYLRKYTSDS